MQPTDENKICPACGNVIPPGSPEALCPACLLSTALSDLNRDLIDPEDLAGLFPQFQIEGLIGQGGAGIVYRARQIALNRSVAIKLIPAEAVRGEDGTSAGKSTADERFQREGRALANLNHPNIVTVHDFGRAGDFFYLVMEFVDGTTLRRVIEDKRANPRAALHIVVQICAALQFAHDRGVVHRDIKPENILLDRAGNVKIADFGLAMTVGDDESLLAEHRVGTPAYMAPEQRDDPQSVDHRADIYALGVLFYELLTGELPHVKYDPPSAVANLLDRRLDQIVLKSLQRRPEQRYQRAAEVGEDVQKCTEAGRIAFVRAVRFMQNFGLVAISILPLALLPLLWTGIERSGQTLLKPTGLSGWFIPRFEGREIGFGIAVVALALLIALLIRRRRWPVAMLVTPAVMLLATLTAFAFPVRTGPLLRRLVIPEFVGRFEFTATGQIVVTRLFDAAEIDSDTGQIRRKYPACYAGVPAPSRFIAVSPDDTRLAITGGVDDEIDLIDRKSGSLVAHIKHSQGTVPLVQFSPDSAQLVVSVNDRFSGPLKRWMLDDETGLMFYDARDGHLIRHFSHDRIALAHGDALHWATPNRLAVADDFSEVDGWSPRVFDPTNDHEEFHVSNAATDRHPAIRLSPDASLIAVSEMGRLWVASMGTREVFTVLRTEGSSDPSQWIKTLCFSPSGRLLASVWPDGAIYIHDVMGGFVRAKYEAKLNDHAQPIEVRFDPHGATVAASVGNEIWIFKAPVP